jgi:hypothetical protein
MFASVSQVELIVCLLWAGFAIVAISPAALLFIGRPKRPRYADIGPSRDQLAPVLAHLWTVHSPKPPHPQAKPLATA